MSLVPQYEGVGVDPPIKGPEPANRTYTKPALPQSDLAGTAVPKEKYKNQVTEARACLLKANFSLAISRNIKTELKRNIQAPVDRLYQLVKESVAEESNDNGSKDQTLNGRTMADTGTKTEETGTKTGVPSKIRE